MPAKNKKSRWGQDNKDDIRSAIAGLASRDTVWKTKSRQRAFKGFCKSRKYKIDRDTPIAKLADILEDYAFNMRRQDGEEYKEHNIKILWNTIAKYLRDLFFEKYGKLFDPYHDIEFAKARAARDGKRKVLQTDPTKRMESSAALSLNDYTKMIQVYNPKTPDGLMKRLFLLLSKDLAWRGNDGWRALVEYFVEEMDDDGNPSGTLKYNPVFSKTHPGESKHLSTDKWLIPNNDDHSMCPVRLYKKMLSLRPSDASNRVFLHPNRNWRRKSEWYTNFPVGKNLMSTWLKEAAKKIGLKGKYSNHSARSTAAAHLASVDVHSNLAMRITGYQNINCIQSYVNIRREKMREIMADLRSGVNNTEKPCVVKNIPGPSRGNVDIASDESEDN